MPRVARLDVTGVLQHVIFRGIEKRKIFLDAKDRQSFLTRFSDLLVETETDCLAWALVPNHAHLLLRPRRAKLASLMRRLLTGYAVTFNLRHQRWGHLFQNRYKSIVCQEDPYLLELVRYIHLNPLRAGLVRDLEGLDRYAWSGHGVLMGNLELAGQKTEEVLLHFGRRIKAARRRYREFVAEGIPQGRRDELVGGGRTRSLKSTGEEAAGEYDNRVLGSGEFVEHLRGEKGLSDRLHRVIPLLELIKKVAALFEMDASAFKEHRRSRRIVEARDILCYFAVREIGHSGAEVGRELNMTRSAVSIAAGRGEEFVRSNPSLRGRFELI